MRFCILIVSPPGWQHAGMYAELAETLVCGLRTVGHEAAVSLNGPDPRAQNILINAHMLPETVARQLPANTIVYNLEHIEPETWDWAPSLQVFLRQFEVWDYSAQNVTRIKAFNPRVLLLPIGSQPELTRIPKVKPQDIDVLFYGYVNERRRPVIDAIAARGLNVQAPFGVYGRARDELIARSKVVLNVHQVEGRVIEMVRVAYLLANRKAVVSEHSAGMENYPGLDGALLSVPYDALADACHRLIRDEAQRRALELAAFRWMAARRQSLYLKDLLKLRAKMR